MFLTPEELADLTGYSLPSKQREWLDARGWVYEVSAFGRVKVLRRYAEMRLGIPVGAAEPRQSEPDFSAIGRAA
jgi:hypothetical protein